MKLRARTMELCGSSYEIGLKLGQFTAAIPTLRSNHTNPVAGFTEDKVQVAIRLFDRWCPGLTEELHGFADALETPIHQILYHGMTYLLPRCSQIATSPFATECGRPLVARNYEFNHEMEDFCLAKTSVTGKNTHMGTSVLHFGRDDGFNEHGLSVTMSSCGFPVGPLPNMRAPGRIGLHYWAVIRALLENCKTVGEALDYVKEMPIAFNLNLLLVDKSGRIALVETLDGHMACKELERGERFLHATNHAVLPELLRLEPNALRHSLIRYEWIRDQLENASNITADDLRAMLLAEFPEGPTCHYFRDFFGTTKSMVIDPAGGTIDLCWGGNIQNGWKQYQIDKPMADTVQEIEIHNQPFDPRMADFVPIKAAAAGTGVAGYGLSAE